MSLAASPTPERPLSSARYRPMLYTAVFFLTLFMVCQKFSGYLMADLLGTLFLGNHFIFMDFSSLLTSEKNLSLVYTGMLVSPACFYSCWQLLLPGGTAREKQYAVRAACISAILFVCGAFFCYYVVLPLMMDKFFQDNPVPFALDITRMVNFLLSNLVLFGCLPALPFFIISLFRAWRVHSVQRAAQGNIL